MDFPRRGRRALRTRLTFTLAGFVASLTLSLLSVALLLAERSAQEREIRRAVEDQARYAAELLTLQLGGVWTSATLLVEHGARGAAVVRPERPSGTRACGGERLAPADSLATRLHWAFDRLLPSHDPPDPARGAFRYDATAGITGAIGAATDPSLREHLAALSAHLVVPGASEGPVRVATSVVWRGLDVGVWLWRGCTATDAPGVAGVTFSRRAITGRVLAGALAEPMRFPPLPATRPGARIPPHAIALRVTDALTNVVLFERGGGLRPGLTGEYAAIDQERRGIRVQVALSDSLTRLLVTRERAPWQSGVLWGLLTLSVLSGIATLASARRAAAGLRAQHIFLAAVSHELRTPLTQMRLSVDLLRRTLRDESERARRAVNAVDRGTHQLVRLVENLLTLAKADSARWRVSRRPTELRALVRTVIDVFAPVAANAGATIALDAPTEIVAPVDPDRFQQVVANLLENALKYGPAGQTVRVARACARGGAAAELRVADQGPGIPFDERPRVWEPLERLTTGAHRTVDGIRAEDDEARVRGALSRPGLELERLVREQRHAVTVVPHVVARAARRRTEDVAADAGAHREQLADRDAAGDVRVRVVRPVARDRRVEVERPGRRELPDRGPGEQLVEGADVEVRVEIVRQRARWRRRSCGGARSPATSARPRPRREPSG